MLDFSDIRAASKDEQIRAWSIEKALESQSGATAESLIYRAALIEDYIHNGRTDG